jgi:ABC-2 type transport system permease protein
MRALRLFWVFFRVGVLGELAYPANFFLQLFESLLDLGTALGGLAVVFAYTETLGGWRPDEVLALVGVFFLVGGVIRLIIQPSMESFIEAVGEGTLDFTLTKPADAQFLVSIQRVEIWRCTDIVLGAIVLGAALSRLGTRVGPGRAAVFAAALLAGLVIVYSFWLILATLSFWLVRVQNILVIFQSMYEAGRWPVGLDPRWMRFALRFRVPVAFATTVPAQALSGRLSGSALGAEAALAAILFLAARLFWRAGLRRYAGASA